MVAGRGPAAWQKLLFAARSKRLVGVMLMRLQLLLYSALSADQHVVLPLTHTRRTLSPSLTSFVVVDLPPVFSFHRLLYYSRPRQPFLLSLTAAFLAPAARPTRFSFASHRTPPSLLADPAINATSCYTSLPSSSSSPNLSPLSSSFSLPRSLLSIHPRAAPRGCSLAGTISVLIQIF